jgi:CubicO group peptidase (beta-lactamase class C family)
MTTDQVGPVDDEGGGWGLGIGVRRTDEPGGRSAGSYGWDGGLGSSWWTDPATGTSAVLLTDQMWSSPQPPEVFRAFHAAAFATWTSRRSTSATPRPTAPAVELDHAGEHGEHRASRAGGSAGRRPQEPAADRSRWMSSLLRTSRRNVTTTSPPTTLSSVVYQNQASQSP